LSFGKIQNSYSLKKETFCVRPHPDGRLESPVKC